MLKMLTAWFYRNFSDPEAIVLLFSLIISAVLIMSFGKILAPLLVSIVIAYVLQMVVAKLERYKCPHTLAVLLVFFLFMGLVVVALLGLLPLIWHQLINLFTELPNMLSHMQNLLMDMPRKYPKYLSGELMENLLGELRVGAVHAGQSLLSYTISSISGVVMLIVYLVIVPFLIYFLLMDREVILKWLKPFLPKQRRLLNQVWQEVREQLGKYILGNLFDIVLFGIVCYALFLIFKLPYALLLSAILGLSVIVPYVGLIIASIPVIIVAFVQFGWTAHLAYFVLIYVTLANLNGNVLAPLLFSEVVRLHPVAVIVALIFFGGLWGFWGVFFAIPLASLVKAVMNAWPSHPIVSLEHD